MHCPQTKDQRTDPDRPALKVYHERENVQESTRFFRKTMRKFTQLISKYILMVQRVNCSTPGQKETGNETGGPRTCSQAPVGTTQKRWHFK